MSSVLSAGRDVELLRALIERVDQRDPGAFNNLGVLYHARALHPEAVDAFLRALGHLGKVKSPTFTVVESYALPRFTVHHFDLYRMAAGELEFIGIEDYFDADADCLMEWAERGAPVLPRPDLALTLTVIDGGREVRLDSHSATGDEVISRLS